LLDWPATIMSAYRSRPTREYAGAADRAALNTLNQVTSLRDEIRGNPLTEQPADATAATTGLTELAGLLLSTEDLDEALHHLARMAVVVVPDGPSCGITVAGDGRFRTVVYSGSIPASVDEAQYERGDGPCLEALRTGAPVIVQDLSCEDQTRWAGFPPVALAAGAHGVLAYPLEVDGQVVGVLNLYAHERNLFPEPVQRIAKQFVDPAALLLSGALRRLSQAELIAHLNAALASRAVIDQAIGIIMARRACSADEAFAVLRRMSNDRNVKLRDVAAAMTESAASGKRDALGG
jgi:transcriptional regulator with GAF, ATPase, and Fis domain